MRLPANFTAKTIVMPTPCIIWTGALNSEGYPCFAVNGVSQLAHRLAYEAACGPIPAGLTIDHLCRVKRCVNHEHLEAVTRSENAKRAAAQDRPTECPKGHEYTPENTRTRRRKNGSTAMACKECQREWTRAANARRPKASAINAGDLIASKPRVNGREIAKRVILASDLEAWVRA